MTPKHVAEYEDAVSRGVGEWLDTLTAEVKGQGGNVDVVPSVKRFAFDTSKIRIERPRLSAGPFSLTAS